MSDWAFFLRESSCRQGGRVGMSWSRLEFADCILHNHALRPDTCPFPKHPVLFSAILNTGYKAPFSLLVISHKKKRELIETMHILIKYLEKIPASRVPIFTISTHCTVDLLTHFPTSRERRERFPKGLRRRTVCSRIPLRHHEWHESAFRRHHAQ